MDAQTIQALANAMQIVGIGAVSVCSLFGISAIALFLVKHYVTRGAANADKRTETREANNAQQLAADSDFRHDLMDRVKVLEAEVKALQVSVNIEMKNNATLTAQNAALEADNRKLTREIVALEKDNRELKKEVEGLRSELDDLKLVVEKQKL